ncbi:helix-hairpin-helix domain-containing protein [uncultured Propionibacterium sp.]|uniref:helix-hairpin-helix domain-containing protein n=1 Tax=uncultured Propionibacterium sp. TaxID=218066 RepID=UPI0029318265|nr:helix-hairpin-helix domain-containing protein [uncultured Propionibacterium sp.]
MAHGFRHDSGGDDLAIRLREVMAGSGPLVSGPRRAQAGRHPDDRAGARSAAADDDRSPVEHDESPAGEDAARDWTDDEPFPERRGAGREPAPGGRSAASILLGHRLHEFGRAHFAVIAVVCAVILAFSITQVLRARATTVDAPSPSVQAEGTGSPASSAAEPASADQSSAAPIRVHIIGAVRSPGVVRVPADARVSDVIDAAGGLNDDADPGELNLAQSVCDGCQIVVGTIGAPRGEMNQPGASGRAGASAAGTGGQPGGGQGDLIDLNSAGSAQLEELPGIGPVLAERIVEWRTQHGRFNRVEELQEVNGIGEKLYSRIKDHVRV